MNRRSRQLYRMIEKLSPDMGLELHRSDISLAERLRLPLKGIPIAILHFTRTEDLLGMLSIKELLFDIRIILSLPDREKETVSKGFLLSPSLLVYPDSDPGLVTEVLKKMLSRGIYNKPIRRVNGMIRDFLERDESGSCLE